MKQDKKEKREIRFILLGKTVLSEDGRLMAKEPGRLIVSQGVVDGAMTVRFLGISRRSFVYDTELEEDALLEAARKTMRDMGRSVCLREHTGTPACLIRYALTGPTVLRFQYAEGKPCLTVWVARGPMGMLTRARAVRAFERAMSDDIRPAQQETSKEEKQEGRPSP